MQIIPCINYSSVAVKNTMIKGNREKKEVYLILLHWPACLGKKEVYLVPEEQQIGPGWRSKKQADHNSFVYKK